MVRTSRVALLTGLSALALDRRARPSPRTRPRTAAAEAEAAAEPTPQPAPTRTIVITGTRRTDRTVADSPVPVDVIGSEAIANSGQTETNKILNQLVPSFNFPQPSIADGSDALRPATLRGLSPDQTLVLINGKRRHVSALLNINGTVGRGSAAVDMNLIPGLAIGRVEVLRDGASAQYGSDAIAGVINIQLKNAERRRPGLGHLGQIYHDHRQRRQRHRPPAQRRRPAAARSRPTTAIFLANTDGERDGPRRPPAHHRRQCRRPDGPQRLFQRHRRVSATATATNRAGFDLRPNYNRPAPPAFDPREIDLQPAPVPLRRPRHRRLQSVRQRRRRARRRTGSSTASAPTAIATRVSAANWRQGRTPPRTATSACSRPTRPRTRPISSPLTPDGFLPLIDTDLDDYAGTARPSHRHRRLEGRPLARLRPEPASTIRSATRSTPRSAPQSQRVFDAGGLSLRPGHRQSRFLEASSRSASPSRSSVAAGAEYRNENFEIRPGDLQSYATGPFFRASITTTAANCTTQQGVFNAGTGVCSFPGRAAPAGAQGFPGIPDVERDRRRPPQLGRLCRARHRSGRGRHHHHRRPLRAFLRLRLDLERQVRRALGAGRGLRPARLDLERLPGAVAPPAILHHHLDQLHRRRAGRHRDARGQQPGRPGARLAADWSPRSRSTSASAPPPTRCAASPSPPTSTRSRSTTGSSSPRISAPAGSGTAAVRTRRSRRSLDANGFQSVGAARFFINGLDTTTRGIDVVAVYRTRIGGPRQLVADRRLQLQQDQDRRAAQHARAARHHPRPRPVRPGRGASASPTASRATRSCSAPTATSAISGSPPAPPATARSSRRARRRRSPTRLSLTAFGPDDIFLKRQVDHRPRAPLQGGQGPRARDRRQQSVRRLSRPARPSAPGRRRSAGSIRPTRNISPYSIFSPFGFNGRFLYGRVALDF